MPPEQERVENGDAELLAELNRVSGRKLGAAALQIAEFSEENEASEKRWSKALSRRTFDKIRRFFFWFLAIAASLTITVCIIAYIYLISLWLGTVLYGTKLHDVTALKQFIDGVLWTLLIIFATLFFEGAFKERDH